MSVFSFDEQLKFHAFQHKKSFITLGPGFCTGSSEPSLLNSAIRKPKNHVHAPMMFQKKELQDNDDTEDSSDTIKQEVVRFFCSFYTLYFSSLSAIGEFCRLLMIFANSLDPGQA